MKPSDRRAPREKMAHAIALTRREVSARLAPLLPRPLQDRFVPAQYRWSRADLKPVAKAGTGDVRLLIAPANFASQAVFWARAAELLPGVFARSLAFGHAPSGMAARPDVSVDQRVGRSSHIWARRQRKQILRDFTHVLYEAERPILGGLYGGDLEAEIRDLQAHGVRVGFISHGSDIRTPSVHVDLEPYSPFNSPLDGLTDALEEGSVKNRGLLERVGLPTFVSTPDLLQYTPDAQWLPTLTDPKPWESLSPSRLGERKPVVLHVPSKSALKGTALIREQMQLLDDEGVIEYREASNVPYGDMPALVESADVVIDQVSMGLYGVASVEALLAGRIVVAQVGDYIRDHIRRETGLEVPIVEVNPKTIGRVVRDIANNPKDYLSRVDDGRSFAHAVHSADRAARVLEPFLLRG